MHIIEIQNSTAFLKIIPSKVKLTGCRTILKLDTCDGFAWNAEHCTILHHQFEFMSQLSFNLNEFGYARTHTIVQYNLLHLLRLCKYRVIHISTADSWIYNSFIPENWNSTFTFRNYLLSGKVETSQKQQADDFFQLSPKLKLCLLQERVCQRVKHIMNMFQISCIQFSIYREKKSIH